MASNTHGSMTRWLAGVVAVLLVAAGYVLAVAASDAPQCCDAMAYQDEARSIVDGAPQLLWVHNYGYAAFLALLQIVGLGDRLGVTLVQTTLLYAAVVAAAVSISRSTHASVPVAMVPLAAVALIPASAWSGYTLSEGLAAPVLLLVLGLVISVTFRVMRATASTDLIAMALVLALGLLSGLAWMIRPALLWVPAATGLILVGISASAAWRRDRFALVLPIGFAVAVLVAVTPQLGLSDPFKLSLARGQAGGGDVYFRYATDVTGCGPIALYISPLTDEALDLAAVEALAPDSVEWRMTAVAAHIVSGWDARPSPTYISSYSDSRWLVVSAFSGFAIMAAATAMAILWRRRATLARPRSAVLAALVILFLISQAALAMTSTEFRFNLAGWLIAGCCLAVISGLRWWTPKRAAAYLVLGMVISSVVLIIGQLTLMQSDAWLRCTGILQ